MDGGAAANNLLMQFQADILRVPVVRPKIVETTALGAAYLAGLAVGFWKDRAEVQRAWEADRTFEPEAERRRGGSSPRPLGRGAGTGAGLGTAIWAERGAAAQTTLNAYDT